MVTIDTRPPLYIIYKEGLTIKAINCTTGMIDYSGTDAATIINNSFNVLTSGRSVFVKNGIYTISSDIVLAHHYTGLIGESWNTQFNLVRDKKIYVHDASSNGLHDVVLSNFLVSSPNHTLNNHAILVLDHTGNILIDHIRVKDANAFGIGIVTNATVASYNTIIQNCYCNGLGNNDVIGGGATSNNTLYDVTIKDNYVIQDSTVGNHYVVAIDMVGVYQYKIINNTTNGNILFGGEGKPNKYSLIYGNIIKPALGYAWGGITIQTTTGADTTTNIKFISIENNVIENGRIRIVGLPTAYASNCMICNNLIDATNIDINDGGIDLTYCTSCNVTNNNIKNGQYGIYLYHTSLTNVTGNVAIGPITGIIGSSSSGNLVQSNILSSNIPITGFDSTTTIRNNTGYKTENNVLSGTFIIDSIGIKTVTIPHGLAIIPAVQDCYLTVVQNTTADDWTYNLLKIVSTDATNVTAKINVSTVSSTVGATARLGLRVGNP